MSQLPTLLGATRGDCSGELIEFGYSGTGAAGIVFFPVVLRNSPVALPKLKAECLRGEESIGVVSLTLRVWYVTPFPIRGLGPGGIGGDLPVGATHAPAGSVETRPV